MSEVFLDNGRTKVTDKQIMHDSTTIPLDMISEVTAIKRTIGVMDFIKPVIGIVIGLYFISLGDEYTIGIGIAIIAITGWISYRMIKKREYGLVIDLFNDKRYTLNTENASVVDEIYEALQQARMSR